MKQTCHSKQKYQIEIFCMEGEVRNNKGMYNQSTRKERKGRGKDGLRQNKKTRTKD